MFQEFKLAPEPLQKQIIIRLGLGTLFFVSSIALLAATGDTYLWFPCAGASVFFVVSAFLLFRRVVLGEYVVVEGKCAEVGTTALRRRARFIIMQTDAGRLKVMLRGRRRKVAAGTAIRLYIANNTPIYEQNGVQVLFAYLALEVSGSEKKSDNG